MTEADWRLADEKAYLVGVTLVRRRWQQSRPNWDHDHCEFCWAEFCADDTCDALREGWTDSDEYHWICDPCFADFKDRFHWRVDEG